MVTALIVLVAALVALRVASYGWYAWKEENNRRGAAGAFITAVVTLLAPLLLLWYYAYFA